MYVLARDLLGFKNEFKNVSFFFEYKRDISKYLPFPKLIYDDENHFVLTKVY
jgi:hypothetical protein